MGKQIQTKVSGKEQTHDPVSLAYGESGLEELGIKKLMKRLEDDPSNELIAYELYRLARGFLAKMEVELR
jgi:hypothetical protein